MRKIKHQTSIIFLSALLSTTSWGQTCLPTQPNCMQERTTRNTHNFDTKLEVPPLLQGQAMPHDEDKQAVRASQQPEQSGRTEYIRVLRGSPTYGAFANDFFQPGIIGVGVSNNYLTPEDAAMAAMQLCSKNAGKQCYLELTYSNRCLGIALAEDQNIYWEINVTPDMAAQSALSTCADKNKTSCKIVYAGCSYAVE